ncbi:MAG: lipoyl synthase [Vampirovibrionales bacterium]|nr:lipoyl synthase [Vampirovibrionales bacterium]
MTLKPKIRLQPNAEISRLKSRLQSLGLVTVCQEAQCPNLNECWSGGTATIMIGGDTCTRGCRFCAVNTGNPSGWLNDEEPNQVAQIVAEGGWRYVVVTSVDRDDLPDGGAHHWAACLNAIDARCPETDIEALIPDFQGSVEALATIAASAADVVAHNLETVSRLTPTVRDRRASYHQSLSVLATLKQLGVRYTKSSLMLGLGETLDEIRFAMADLRRAEVDFLTLGQYLQPSPKHLPVKEMLSQETFLALQRQAEQEFGFAFCAAGSLVRSSYKAGEWFTQAVTKKTRHQ